MVISRDSSIDFPRVMIEKISVVHPNKEVTDKILAMF